MFKSERVNLLIRIAGSLFVYFLVLYKNIQLFNEWGTTILFILATIFVIVILVMDIRKLFEK